jgi:tetratricopeptide (TPR) repeat protein
MPSMIQPHYIVKQLLALSRDRRLILLISARGLLLIAAALLSGCAGRYIDVPQPSLLSLPPTSSMVIAIPDASYREVALGLELKKQMRTAQYYPLLTDREVRERLRQIAQSIENIGKDPKLAQGLKADVVLTSGVVAWERNTGAPERRIVSEAGRVVQYCSPITGTLRASFTLWKSDSGQKVFNDETSASRRAWECADDLNDLQSQLKAYGQTGEKAVTTASGGSVPDPFLEGVFDKSWVRDSLFEAASKKAVAAFIDDFDPNPLRSIFIVSNDGTGYKSGRKLAKARNYLRDDNWAAAIKVLEENLRNYPDSYSSQYLMGVAQQGQKNFGTAKNSYKQAWLLCKTKLDAADPDRAPECDYIEEAYNRSQKWDAETTSSVPLKPIESH